MKLEFSHPKIGGLEVKIGPDEIGWGYMLNTANFPTYGGEVIQILSVYIDDLRVSGLTYTYNEAERIYSYFAKYMSIATQGATGDGSYDQTPMKLYYPHRQWTFEIQPKKAPGFVYSLETIAPEWRLEAHVVDRTPDVSALADLVVKNLLNGHGGEFSLTGFVSPDAPEPSKNPFAAPGTSKGNTFTPLTKDQISAEVKRVADWYNKLIPSYAEGDYASITGEGGARPAFGKITAPENEPIEKKTQTQPHKRTVGE